MRKGCRKPLAAAPGSRGEPQSFAVLVLLCFVWLIPALKLRLRSQTVFGTADLY